MKRIIILLVFITGLLNLASAVDFGLLLDNTTSASTDPNNIFYQEDKASLWLTFDFSDKIFLSITGFYRFDITEPYHTYGLDRLEFSADFTIGSQPPFLIGFSLGRFYAQDFSGLILAHPLDGLNLRLRTASMNMDLSFGYTGLIFKGESGLAMSVTDCNYSPVIPLVPPRLVGMLGFDFPELFAYQTLYLSVAGQLDLHSEDVLIQPGSAIPDYSRGGRIDTLYTGLGLKGPIFGSFYWSSVFYFEFGRTLSYFDSAYNYVPIYSYLASLAFDWFVTEFQYSHLRLEVILASGDGDYTNFIEGNTDEFSTQFIPLTRQSRGLVYALQLSNVIVASLSYGLKLLASSVPSVLNNLQTELIVLTYFRSALSDVSDSGGLNSGSSQYYLGNEIDLVISFRPFVDLGLELALGLFLPNNYSAEAAFAPDGREIEFLARLRLSLEF